MMARRHSCDPRKDTMKKLTHELTYPATGIEQVAAMLGDPAFREAVCDAQRVLRKSVTITPAGEGKTVEIESVQATSGVPGFAKRIVGDETTVVTVERWSSPTAAVIEVTIPGKPGTMTGHITLEAAADGVVQTVELEISVSVPLVGGKVEGMLVDLMEKAYRTENRVGRDWLVR